jgi:hypothetical protein
VYVVDAESKVHMRPVTVRLALESETSIATGLEVGENVVVDGTDRLVEGATVRLRTDADVNGSGGRRGGRGGSGRGARGGSGRRGGGGAAPAGRMNAAAGVAGGRGGANGARGGGRGANGARARGPNGAPLANAVLDPDAPPPLDLSTLDIGCPGGSRTARGGRQGGGRRGGGGGQ